MGRFGQVLEGLGRGLLHPTPTAYKNKVVPKTGFIGVGGKAK